MINTLLYFSMTSFDNPSTLSRYDLFITKKMLTHLTTSLTSIEIDEIYGLRFRSRLREKFNLIAFDSNSKDKLV